MIIGAILAGGQGTRLGGELPKQFLPLGDKPVLCHALGHFLACSEMDEVLVVVPQDRIAYTEELLRPYDGQTPIRVIVGGADRTGSLQNVLRAIDEQYGESDEHIVITHDAARPFINTRILRDNIAAVRAHGACGTAMPMIDSVIESADGITIDRMPDRARFYKMQTPQSFRVNLLKACFDKLTESQKAALTDGCNVCRLAGEPVAIVRGSDYNLKITTAADLKMAQLVWDGGLTDDDV